MDFFCIYLYMHSWQKYVLHFLVQWLYTSAFILVLVAYINYKYIECVYVVPCTTFLYKEFLKIVYVLF
jgi:hypothetical protein